MAKLQSLLDFGIELLGVNSCGARAVAVLVMLLLQGRCPLLHPTAQCLAVPLPPGVVQAVEGIERLPPLARFGQPFGPGGLQSVAVPVAAQRFLQRGSLAWVGLLKGGEGRHGPLGISPVEAAQGLLTLAGRCHGGFAAGLGAGSPRRAWLLAVEGAWAVPGGLGLQTHHQPRCRQGQAEPHQSPGTLGLRGGSRFRG